MDKKEFKNHVLKWAEKIGVSKQVKGVYFRVMKRKLASCSKKGRLTFDVSLLNKDPKEIDYVIVHELLHLRYPNHGKMFKRLLQIYVNSI